MREAVRAKSTFLNQGLLYQSDPEAHNSSKKKPTSTNGNTSAKKQLSMPIAQKGRNTKAWTTISWPTNVQSRTPDGKFGPARQMKTHKDAWFLASVAAVVNDLDGTRKLAQNITRVVDGYKVKFEGLPNFGIVVSDDQLNKCLDQSGGDADTRIVELAAINFFQNIEGGYKRLYLNICEKLGFTKEKAEASFELHCHEKNYADPLNYNPMINGGSAQVGLAMLTGKYPDTLIGHMKMKRSEIMEFLNKHIKNDWDHPSVVISGRKNPLGRGHYTTGILLAWDAIRTDITADKKVDPAERAFLEGLDQYLNQQSKKNWIHVYESAEKLNLEHISPTRLLDLLDLDYFTYHNKEHIQLLQYGIHDILRDTDEKGELRRKAANVNGSSGTGNNGSKNAFRKSSGDVHDWTGTGFIGFSAVHSGYLIGINEKEDTFTYSEPLFPTMQHTGILSRLIAEIQLGEVALSSVEPEVIDCPIY